MPKSLTVMATQRGYYAGQIREPNDHFELASEKDFSKNWMLPVDAKTFRAAEKAAESDEVNEPAPGPTIEKKPEPKAEIDYSEMTAFQGVKQTYGTEDIKISLDEAKERALQEFGHPIAKWNSELDPKDRQKRILKAVADLVKEQQAEKASK